MAQSGPVPNLTPVNYDWIPKSIDAAFNMYQQSRANAIQNVRLGMEMELNRAQLANQQQQLAANKLDNIMKFGGVDPSTITGDQIAQAQGSQPIKQIPNLQAPQLPGQGMLGLGAPVPMQDDPQVTALKGLFDMARQSRVLGMQRQEADTSKIQSEAALNNMWTGGAGSLGIDQWKASTRQAVESGQMAPSQAFAEASRVGPQGLGRVAINQALEGLPIADLEAGYAAKTKAAEYNQGNQVQAPSRLIESAKPILNNLAAMAEAYGAGNNQALNSLKLRWGQLTGKPAPQNFETAMEEGKAQLAQIFASGGAPTDVAQKRADTAIPTGASPAQLRALANDNDGLLTNLLTWRGQAVRGEKVDHSALNKQAPSSDAKPIGPAVMRTLRDGTMVRVAPIGGGRFIPVP